jgi:hypothetical protein
MAHSNQIREFLLTDHGIELTKVYLGPEGVLTGTARQAQEAKESAEATRREQQIEARRRELARKRQALEARIVAMRKDFEAEEEESERIIGEEEAKGSSASTKQEQNGRHASGGFVPPKAAAFKVNTNVEVAMKTPKPDLQQAPDDEKWQLRLYTGGTNPKVAGCIREPETDLRRIS